MLPFLLGVTILLVLARLVIECVSKDELSVLWCKLRIINNGSFEVP